MNLFLKDYKRFITASAIGSLFWIIFFYFPPYVFSLLLFSILCAIIFIEWKNLFKKNPFLYWFLMPLYPILPFVLIIYFNQTFCYRTLLYYLFTIVFTFDSGAYIVGSFLGKTKIAPNISPNKTVEGCIGGYISSLIIFYMFLYKPSFSPVFGPLFVLALCTTAIIGDLFESYLKRKGHVKDSGTFLPGHGGFLDRFDAAMAAALFMFIFKTELTTVLCT